MKLLRYGAAGSEKPGLLDADGKIRDLSAHIPDLTVDRLSDESLGKLKKLDPDSLPAVTGSPARPSLTFKSAHAACTVSAFR